MMAKAYNLANHRLSKKYVYGKDFGFTIWLHDEWEIECREDIAEDVAKISAQAIVDAGKFYNISCPHVGDSKIGATWYAVH